MPRIKFTQRYLIDAARLHDFLVSQRGRAVAVEAGKVIDDAIDTLTRFPEGYKPTLQNPKLRQMGIPFQSKGYMLLYSYTKSSDTVTLLAMKHQLENDYK
jgi:plasmid stabilization system protein ParE